MFSFLCGAFLEDFPEVFVEQVVGQCECSGGDNEWSEQWAEAGFVYSNDDSHLWFPFPGVCVRWFFGLGHGAV